ncbi:DUF4351 domain-containing protein [Clostridium perfringens]|nr:DUF4351 domain-containing protein [Clostridium perfringens]
MTDIGKMIRDEAIKEGIREGLEEGSKEGILKGKEEGKAEMLIRLLVKKFKFVPDEYKKKIRKLSEESIDVIATDIFDIEKIEDVEKYF